MKKIFMTALVLQSAIMLNAAGKIDDKAILVKVSQNIEYVNNVRGYLHQNPELSGKEYETTRYLKSELAKIGNFEIHDVPGCTGFYAILNTGKPGKTIGLRTDIDALSVKESAVNGGGQKKKWTSKVDGVSHVCGHDGHMATMLGTAKILWSLRNQLKGKYVLVFEHGGEDNDSGIWSMLKALKGVGLDAMYGYHLASNVPSGQIFLTDEAVMAGLSTIAFNVNGRGGRGSRPDLAINPIFAAADILTSIPIAWNSQKDLTKLVSLGITRIEGGEADNIIPDQVHIGGTLCFFAADAGAKAMEIVKKVAENVAAAHGCTISYEPTMLLGYPPVLNDATLVKQMSPLLSELFPGHVVTDRKYAWHTSETFSLYSRICPTLFTLIGARSDSKGITAEHHSAEFDIDEAALPYAVGTMVKAAIEFGR